MDILARIIETKRKRLEALKAARPEADLRREAVASRAASKQHAFVDSLSNGRINVIAEFKRRSPSKGMIRKNADPETVAHAYESGGASAISVLTEEDYFDGSLVDLRTVKTAVSLSILRKDFIFDEYQVYESAFAGADALLLIVAALDNENLVNLRRLAEDELGLDALVEVHTADEMLRAADCGARLIGVNNRSLKTFEVSLETSAELAAHAPANAILVSESGLDSHDDLKRLHGLGYKGFLIGESLMRSENPEQSLRALLKAHE